MAANCHPFRHGRWLFVHNGVIEAFEMMRRDLMLAVDPSLFVSNEADAIKRLHPENARLQRLRDEDRVVVSEPLADLEGVWHMLPESSQASSSSEVLEQRRRPVGRREACAPGHPPAGAIVAGDGGGEAGGMHRRAHRRGRGRAAGRVRTRSRDMALGARAALLVGRSAWRMRRGRYPWQSRR